MTATSWERFSASVMVPAACEPECSTLNEEQGTLGPLAFAETHSILLGSTWDLTHLRSALPIDRTVQDCAPAARELWLRLRSN